MNNNKEFYTINHLGDITLISGHDVPCVDVVIGGSPCQDLSIAGRREGLAGERSGLFMEQIRIIKEMRNADKQRGRTGTEVQPRFMVWENVPGAFSSNKGEDFRCVLEETAKIANENAGIPEPPKGKWSTAGAVMGDGWSIAWRVLDAQFWGVPQRRRRIALVADFGGQTAPEILFERESVCGNPSESNTQREGASTRIKNSHGTTEPTVICLQGNGIDRADTAGCNGKGWKYDQCYTLNTIDRPAVAYSFDSLSSNSMKSSNPHSGCRSVDVSKTLDTTYPDPSKNQGGIAIVQPVCYDARGNGDGNVAPCITGDHQNRITDYTAITLSMQSFGEYRPSNVVSPLKARDYKDATDMVIECSGIDCRNMNESSELYPTLQAKPNGGQSLNFSHAVRTASVVRRLTPLECERLQGYPDGWTNIGDWIDSKGKKHKLSDSARYKALGNSIALPPWRYVLSRLCKQIGRTATMASLFYGIGGFPLIWEEINGPGSCLWASEIEEFPIAVTSMKFCK